ncbi:hypothetical protein MGYG_09104 [Nannizzia gypsea CBS 118893]|uniref:Uncharacterized protein n=1 Tax=Arthroderma gypseum (strain ATCC MYA-4604 / CBS 118893) TaxID=535722 RepID=E4V021_ARTGP|nr:hypothetical protein MGYG_09104 [Nannizzia gypsea CBS 118893]EFR02958.1 hypothetical protein MGYG_09104 [Nannizzia gypsea CBS 118893]
MSLRSRCCCCYKLQLHHFNHVDFDSHFNLTNLHGPNPQGDDLLLRPSSSYYDCPSLPPATIEGPDRTAGEDEEQGREGKRRVEGRGSRASAFFVRKRASAKKARVKSVKERKAEEKDEREKDAEASQQKDGKIEEVEVEVRSKEKKGLFLLVLVLFFVFFLPLNCVFFCFFYQLFVLLSARQDH